MEDPAFIIGRALASWANPPRWRSPNTNCTREESEAGFTEFVADVCRNWGLVIIRTAEKETCSVTMQSEAATNDPNRASRERAVKELREMCPWMTDQQARVAVGEMLANIEQDLMNGRRDGENKCINA